MTPRETIPELQRKLDFISASPTNVLTLTYPNHPPTPNGASLPKSHAADEPTLKLPPSKSDPTKTYIVIYYDPDPPVQYGQCLHWAQSGLTASPDGTLSYDAEAHPWLADHRGPNPPPGTGPHRYVFVVYETPEGFEADSHRMAPRGEKVPVFEARVHFLLEEFERALGLGEPVAGTHFTCEQ